MSTFRVRAVTVIVGLATAVLFVSPLPAASRGLASLGAWPDWLVFVTDACCDGAGYAMRLDGTGVTALAGGLVHAGEWVPSPDGTRVGFRGPGPALYVQEMTGSAPRVVREGHGAWAWSPDGARIAVANGTSVDLFDPDTGASTRLLTLTDVRPSGTSKTWPASEITDVQWPAASDRLAVVVESYDGGLVLASETAFADADGSRIVRRGPVNPARALILSADGTTVAWQAEDGTRRLASSYDLSDQRTVESNVQRFDYWPLTWSTRGAQAAWIADDAVQLLVSDRHDTQPQVRYVAADPAIFVGPWVDERRVSFVREEETGSTVLDVDEAGVARTYAQWKRPPDYPERSISVGIAGPPGDGRNLLVGVSEFTESTGLSEGDLWLVAPGMVPERVAAPSDAEYVQLVSARLGVTVRFAGVERTDTAVQVSKAGFTTADTVVIARADAYPDALAGAPLAGKRRAPLLLSGRDELSAITAQQIGRLGPSKAVILGTTDVVGAGVEAQLRQLGVEAIQRIGGTTRFETAAGIARAVGAPDSTAILVLGAGTTPDTGWADAVAVSGYAARTGTPVLLTLHDTIPQATLDALRTLAVDTVTIVGGTAAVSHDVETQLRAHGFTTERLAGSDRFATSIAVAERDRTTGGDPARMWAVTGTNWPDALAAGPAAASVGGLVLLVPPTTAGATYTYIADRDPDQIVISGGIAAVSRPVQRVLATASN